MSISVEGQSGTTTVRVVVVNNVTYLSVDDLIAASIGSPVVARWLVDLRNTAVEEEGQ